MDTLGISNNVCDKAKSKAWFLSVLFHRQASQIIYVIDHGRLSATIANCQIQMKTTVFSLIADSLRQLENLKIF